MVNLKAIGIAAGIGLAGLAGYTFFWPNTGLYWLSKIGARNKEEVEGYFSGIIRGIKKAGGHEGDFWTYLNEWKTYWKSVSPDAINTVEYWADYAKDQWEKVS